MRLRTRKPSSGQFNQEPNLGAKTNKSNLNSRRTKLESEGIVAELVHGFLIPETSKEVHRQQSKFFRLLALDDLECLFEPVCSPLSIQVKLKQEPFLIAAHKEIYDATCKAMSNDTQEQASQEDTK